MLKKYLCLIFVIVTMSGCTAAKTVMKKRELSVESHVSFSVNLEPLAPEERIVYVRVKDLSGNDMRKEMTEKIRASIEMEGLKMTNNPKEANLMLNASIVSAKNTTKEEMTAFVRSGYQAAGEGLLAAGSIAAVSTGRAREALAIGLAGAAVGFLADSLVEDTYYTFVMDVELRERPLAGDQIENKTSNNSFRTVASNNSAISSASSSNVTRGDNYNWIVYETRIVSVANKMNLKIEDAIPVVQDKTSSTLVDLLL